MLLWGDRKDSVVYRRIYFDTDCFHHFARTFADNPLPNDLRENILLSPVTMMEMLSHLARHWGDDVHEQIRGMKNWLNCSHAMVLPFMDEAISVIGFGAKVVEDGYTKHLQDDINNCAVAELWELQKVAEARDTEIQNIKAQYARSFEDVVAHFRNTQLTENAFTDLWLARFRRVSAAEAHPKTNAEVVTAFSALHEYEYEKLKVAVADPHYKPMNHVNDLFDAEQLIYLGDPTLHFLTVDKGYLNKVKTSPQRDRIHRVDGSELDDLEKAEALLRKITT